MSLSEWQKENPSEAQDLKILYELVLRIKPKVILEVGSGHTTLAMSLAISENGENGRIFTTDIDENRIRTFDKKAYETPIPGMIKSACYTLKSYIEFSNKDSIEFLSDFEGLADLIFIDSSHIFEQTFKEIIEAVGKLAPNGYIILHDVFSMKGVSEAIATFLYRNPDEYKYFTLKTECGLGVLQRK